MFLSIISVINGFVRTQYRENALQIQLTCFVSQSTTQTPTVTDYKLKRDEKGDISETNAVPLGLFSAGASWALIHRWAQSQTDSETS